MSRLRTMSRLLTRASLVAVASVALAGCSDDPVEPEPEPQIANIIVTSGTSSVTIPATGTHSGTLSLKVSTANAVSVRFVNAAGADEPVIAADRDEFEVRITPTTPGAATTTFSAGTGSTYTGTLTPTATGTATYTLVLFAKDHDHQELSKTLTATVVP